MTQGIPDATPIVLTEAERAELDGLLRSTRTEHRLRQRARIVLLAAVGIATREISGRVGCTTGAAWKWRVRYAERRLAGLDETGNRGVDPKYTAETTRRILCARSQTAPRSWSLDQAAHRSRARRCRSPAGLARAARAQDRPRRPQELVREQRSRVRRQGRRGGRALHGPARERARHLR